jgi:hypothetical protein
MDGSPTSLQLPYLPPLDFYKRQRYNGNMKMKIVNHSTKPIDLTEKLKPYNNKWVAFSLDHKKVFAAADTLQETKRKAEKQNKKYLLLKLPPFNVMYIPSF